ncbi:hypothetical protein BOW55_05090 [Flavobacterium sp. YO12]|nr:hypothetical protein BOW55_05090 [Flavobacterium sp. YO12]
MHKMNLDMKTKKVFFYSTHKQSRYFKTKILILQYYIWLTNRPFLLLKKLQISLKLFLVVCLHFEITLYPPIKYSHRQRIIVHW